MTKIAAAALCALLSAACASEKGAEKSSGAASRGKHHVLKAPKEEVQWGWLDPREKPRLTIDSGDTVSIETLSHALDQIHGGVDMNEIVRLRKANPGGGPHSLTGPVVVNGAKPGDSHCLQGNGEVNLTALECSYKEIELQPIVHHDMKLTWPRIETPTHYIMVGFDEDLGVAMANAVRETVDFLSTQKGLTREEAYSLTSIVGDCRVSQVVDVRKGVHCMVPKSIFTK